LPLNGALCLLEGPSHLKIKHYAQPLKTIASSAFDNCGWEIVVAFVSGIFCYASYSTGFGILFFPMFAVFCLTVLSMLLNVFFAIKECLSERQSKK
jgi:hypothetical protein